MWALEALGLDSDADARAVKRAYARCLKTTRPDADPEGFQRLHAAYQAALAAVQEHAPRPALEPPAVEHRSPTPTPSSAPSPPGEPVSTTETRGRPDGDAHSPADTQLDHYVEAFDADAFLAGCIAQLVHGEPDDVRRWLEAQPALWSLQLKSQLGYWVLNQLHERSPPVPEDNFDALLDFFDLDHVLSGVDPDAVMHLRTRLGFRRDLQPGRERALGNRVFMGRPTHDRHAPALSMMRQLRRPLRWWQALPVALLPRRSRQLRYFVLALDDGDFDGLAGLIDLEQARFWLAADDASRQSRARRLVALARCVLVAASISLLFGLLHGLTDEASAEVGLVAAQAGTVIKLFAGLALFLYAAWEAWVMVERNLRWQSAPEDAPTRFPILRFLWIPLLAGLCLLFQHGFGLGGLASVTGGAAVLSGAVRVCRRAGLKFSFGGWRLLLLIPFLKGLAFLVALIVVNSNIAVWIALPLWAIDAFRHRSMWRSLLKSMSPRRPALDSEA